MRICIVQPLVPQYRVPVFRELSRSQGIDLEVWADTRTSHGSLVGIRESSDFQLRHASYLVKAGVVWQPEVLRAVRSSFDVVVLNDNVRNPCIFPSLLMRRRPVVLWGHGFGTHHEKLGARLRKLSFSLADAGLLYGERGRDRIASLGVPVKKLFVAPNAVDQTAITAARMQWNVERLEAFRAEHRLDGWPHLLFISRLEPEKLPEMAIDALRRIRCKHPEARLTFIGEGSCRKRLEQYVCTWKLQDCVHFAGGIFDESRLAPWALSADLLVHPGALGLSIFTAFGFGLPVVTTDCQTIQMPEAECLIPGLNGLLYAHGQSDSLADTCCRIIEEPQLHRRLREGALATVQGPSGRNIPAMVDGFLRAIDFARAGWRKRLS